MGQKTDREWAQAWAADIGQNIQRTRKSHGMSAAQLSEACSRLGYRLPRSTIANLESGRKESVPVHEVVVIAEALGVAPMQLLYPIDRPSLVDYLPEQEISAHSAWSKFGRGLNLHIGTGEIASASPAELPQAVLTNYTVMTRNEQAWLQLREASRQMNRTRDSSAERLKAYSQDMDMILAETLWAFDEMVDAGLPLPVMSQDFLEELRELSEYDRERQKAGKDSLRGDDA